MERHSKTLGFKIPEPDFFLALYKLSLCEMEEREERKVFMNTNGKKRRNILAFALIIIFSICFFSMANAQKPNLTPYQPPGYSDKIILTKTPCVGTADDAPIYDGDTLYLRWWITNNGAVATTTNAEYEFYLDGNLVHTSLIGPLEVSQAASCCLCESIGPLSDGTHTVKIAVDTTNVIDESDENDNEYTKMISVDTSPPSPSGLYDDFSGGYINRDKWIDREFVREIKGGKLILKNASPDPTVITAYPYRTLNDLTFYDPDSVSSIQADVAVTENSITSNGYTRARIGGRWYNDGSPGEGMIGDIWAEVVLWGDSTGLSARWEVSKFTNAGGTTFQNFGSGTFTTPIILGTTYTLYISYDDIANIFTFRVEGEEITFGPTGLPSRVGYSKMPSKVLTARVQIDDPSSSAYISATYDNVYKNGSLYDDFSSSTIDSAKWTTYEYVREISAGKFRSKVRSSLGSTSSVVSRLRFPSPSDINAIQTKVTPLAYENNEGADLRARIMGHYYNDGTPGGGYIGDVGAQVRIRGTGPNLVAEWSSWKYTDFVGSAIQGLAQGTFNTPVSLGSTYTLFLGWDGMGFTFKINDEEAYYFPTTSINQPNNPLRSIETQILYPTGQEASIEALFDDVVIETQLAEYAYVSNSDSNNVSVIDTGTNTVIAAIPVQSRPIGVAVNPAGTRAYIANLDSNSISVIDTSNNAVISTITGVIMPLGIAVTPDGARVYVSGFTSSKVFVIDTSANTITKTITVGGIPEGLAISPDGTRVYVPNGTLRYTSVIDTSTDTVITTIPVGDYALGVAINPAGTRAYVTNYNNHNVSVINASTNTVVTTIPVVRYPYGIVVNPGGTRAYVTGTSSVSVIDTATNTVNATIPLSGWGAGVSINPDGTRLYVAQPSQNYVSVIDTSTNTVVTTIPVGSNPRAFGNFITAY